MSLSLEIRIQKSMERKIPCIFYKKHLTNHTKSEAKPFEYIHFFWRFQMADYSLITKHKLLHMMEKNVPQL